MAMRDWTPRKLPGGKYCSPACAGAKGFCTEAEFKQATREAAALAKFLGDGWEPCVHENLGWHYSASKGVATVYPHIRRNLRGRWKIEGYWASINTSKQFIGEAKTPEDALGFAVQDARGASRKIARDLDTLLEAA